MAEQDAPSEVFQRTRRSPYPDGTEPFDDCAVDVGWYDEHEVGGGRDFLERFGHIPAPATLSEFVRTVQQIASAANGQMFGWRGQSNARWAVRECADLLNMTQDRVIELAKRGTLRSRGGLVQPALTPGYTA